MHTILKFISSSNLLCDLLHDLSKLADSEKDKLAARKDRVTSYWYQCTDSVISMIWIDIIPLRGCIKTLKPSTQTGEFYHAVW